MTFIKNLFASASDRRIVDAINIRNLRNIFIFSAIACLFDAVTLALFSVVRLNDPNFRHTFQNVAYCVVACALVIFLSKAMIRKYEKEGNISNTLANALASFFYALMSAWGIMVDTAHYSAGEQMLTFYIVQFCFLCFVVMHRKLGSVLIVLSFSSLYLCVYFIDGAVRMQPQNYICFMIIAVAGNLIQNTTLQKSEKAKLDILELNQLLQQEAAVDELTQLKNRKALHDDFEKYIGKSVYVIMSDVDDFKSYNDTYGHVVGDNVLRLVADTIKTAFCGDAYRYGGDEFLIILTDYSDADFNRTIEEWKKAILSIQIAKDVPIITCSYGCERCVIENADDLRTAIKHADDRLYKAKKMRG